MSKLLDELAVFDGAMGTELYERGFYINKAFEELNLIAEKDVVKVHRDYIDAGANFITTNSHSLPRTQLQKFDLEEKQADLLEAALKNASLAREDAKSSVKIAFSLGPMGVPLEPLGPLGLGEVQKEFAHLGQLHKNSKYKSDLIILESFTNVLELNAAMQGVRSVDTEIPLIVSFAHNTKDKELLDEFMNCFEGRDDILALGLNCAAGPFLLLKHLQYMKKFTQKPLLIQPNAGIPRQVNGRYVYMTSPDYMAKFAKRFIEAGAWGVGGCCGTRPDHIMAISRSLGMMGARYKSEHNTEDVEVLPSISRQESKRQLMENHRSYVARCLKENKKFLSIELSPPKGTNLESFFEKLIKIEAAGIGCVNVPDGPRASMKVSSLHLSVAVKNQYQGTMTVLPHFTSRDRNLLALHADLLGASMNGIHDVLLVTGDPPKLGNNKESTGVYDIDSIGMTHLLSSLNHGKTPQGEFIDSQTHYAIGVASNPTALNLELEYKRWNYKADMGADFAVTQPIYEPETFLRWRDKLGEKYRPSFIGIWPFISLRNAEFMANEVPGVFVPQWALEEMSKANGSKEESIKRGVEIAHKVITKLNDACEGYAISAPLGKVEVAIELAKVSDLI